MSLACVFKLARRVSHDQTIQRIRSSIGSKNPIDRDPEMKMRTSKHNRLTWDRNRVHKWVYRIVLARHREVDRPATRNKKAHSQSGFGATSRLRGIWDCCRRRSRAGSGDDSGISTSRATLCCGSYWWKRPRLRCAAIPNGGASFFHLAMCRRRQIAKVAMVRKLSILCIPPTVLLLLQALLEYGEVVIVYMGY